MRLFADKNSLKSRRFLNNTHGFFTSCGQHSAQSFLIPKRFLRKNPPLCLANPYNKRHIPLSTPDTIAHFEREPFPFCVQCFSTDFCLVRIHPAPHYLIWQRLLRNILPFYRSNPHNKRGITVSAPDMIFHRKGEGFSVLRLRVFAFCHTPALFHS